MVAGYSREDGRLYPVGVPGQRPASTLKLMGIGMGAAGFLGKPISVEAARTMLDDQGLVVVRSAIQQEWVERACFAVADVVMGDEEGEGNGSGGVVVGGVGSAAGGDAPPRFLQYTLQAVKGKSPGLTEFVRMSQTAELAAAMLLNDEGEQGTASASLR